MKEEIPIIVEALYRYFVTSPDPRFWPDYLKKEPVQGHGLWSFFQGLKLGMQLSAACLEQH